MCPAIATIGDLGSAHGGFPATPILSGSVDVLVQGRGVARQGDSLLAHAKPKEAAMVGRLPGGTGADQWSPGGYFGLRHQLRRCGDRQSFRSGGSMTAMTGLQFTLTLDAMPDANLVVVSFTGQEAPEPFVLQLECASQDAELPLPELLNSQGTLTIWQDGTAVRRVTGILAAATQAHAGCGVPAIACNCARRSGVCSCAIIAGFFKDKRLPGHHGPAVAGAWHSRADFVLRGAHPPRDYCVQYRETDLAFLQRLAAGRGDLYFRGDDRIPLSLQDLPTR